MTKLYVIPKDNQNNIYLGIKCLKSPHFNGLAPCGAMPQAFGGTQINGDSERVTLGKELREESRGVITMFNYGAPILNTEIINDTAIFFSNRCQNIDPNNWPANLFTWNANNPNEKENCAVVRISRPVGNDQTQLSVIRHILSSSKISNAEHPNIIMNSHNEYVQKLRFQNPNNNLSFKINIINSFINFANSETFKAILIAWGFNNNPLSNAELVNFTTALDNNKNSNDNSPEYLALRDLIAAPEDYLNVL